MWFYMMVGGPPSLLGPCIVTSHVPRNRKKKYVGYACEYMQNIFPDPHPLVASQEPPLVYSIYTS